MPHQNEIGPSSDSPRLDEATPSPDTPQGPQPAALADAGTAPSAGPSAQSSWFRPCLLDFLFLTLVIWLFLAGPNGWIALLSDGDTGWHIRVGDWMRQHRQFPTQDFFSFSKAGEAWYAWEWLSELLFSYLHEWNGLKGVVWFTGMLIPSYLILVFRHMLWRRTTPLLGLAVLLVLAGSSAIHYLARPHLFTLLFLAASLWLLAVDREHQSRKLWLLVPLTVLWTNLHGGFLSLVACLGLFAVGQLLEKRQDLALRYALCALLCLAASLINPYGWHLHQHVIAYLRSDWIRNVVEEFQSPRFRSEAMYYYEALLLAAFAATAGLARRGRWSDVCLIVGWAHISLGAVRHVPIFMLVAAPAICEQFSIWWRELVAAASKRSLLRTFDDISKDLVPKLGHGSLWMATPVVVLALLDQPIKWPKQFPDQKFPVALVEKHQSSLLGKKVLASDEYGDYLLYRFFPQQRVFFDGRSDFFGPSIGNDYIDLMNAAPKWKEIVGKYGFEAALLPAAWPLVEWLKRDPAWQVTAQDKDAVILTRVPEKRIALPSGTGGLGNSGSKDFVRSGLMNQPQNVESSSKEQLQLAHGAQNR